jgi:thioredoxin reductase (NADPH)
MPKNNNEKTQFDVAILGSGPAGLTAAIYTSRALLKTVVFAGNPPGGQLTTTTEVENFPGFPKGIQGPDLIAQTREQAQRFGTVFIDQSISQITGTFNTGFTLTSESGEQFQARTIIIASGASAKWLGLESEQRLRGKGVSACATCDAFFFRDKEVVIVGAGDAAMMEANFLTRFASKVHVLVRKSKEEMRASKIMQERALSNEKIEFHFYTELLEILGQDKVSGVKLINNQTQKTSVLDAVEGVFVAIGHEPNTMFLQGFVDLDAKGYVKVTEGTFTSAEGVFAAGDAVDYKYRQGITAAGFGCMASIDLERFLAERE